MAEKQLLADKPVSWLDLIRYEEEVQGQILAVWFTCRFLLQEFAPTPEARQRVEQAMEKAALEFETTMNVRVSKKAAELLRDKPGTLRALQHFFDFDKR